MGKILTTIKNFDGGVANDIRDPRKDKCRMVTNFDISSSSRMTPYRDSEDGDSGSATSQKQNFAIALRTGTTYSLYGLGVKSGAGTAEVLYKNLTVGTGDLGDNTWASLGASAKYQSSAGAVNFNCFVYYKNQGLIYGGRAGTHIWAYEPTGGTGWADTDNTVAYTNLAQGLVHSKDDILYIPYDNKIMKKNGAAAWVDAAITLPEHLKINSICEYGNYLAIGAAPLSGIGNSVVYLWDRDATLATLSESIDWGTGELKILEEVDGYLVGISLQGNIAPVNNDRIIFRYLTGNRAVKYDELVGDLASTTDLPISKQKINNRVYFMMRLMIDGENRDGVWSFGRSLIEPSFTIVHERTPDDDTVLVSGVIKNFFIVGDFMFQSFVNSSSAFQMTKTNNAASYTATSIYEKLFNTVDSQTTKKLLGVSAMFADLPTNAQVVLKYKIDENIPASTFVTVFTHATAGSIRHTAINDLPEYKEIVFRIESTKGAEITGLKFLEETKDDDLLKYA